MRINLFEGGRRIAYIITAATLAVAAYSVASYDPYINATYMVVGNGAPVALDDRCSGASQVEVLTPAKNSLQVNVCTYMDDKGQVQSPHTFQLPHAEGLRLDEEIQQRKSSNTKESLQAIGGGLALFWAFVWALGWTVRGCFGIPNGADRKPT